MNSDLKHNELERSRTDGSIAEVRRVATPLVVAMLSYTLMALADTWFVSYLGKTEVAGVGLATTATFAIICFGLGLLNGVKVVVAQAFGADEHDRANVTPWLGVVVAVGFGALVLLFVPLADPLLQLMGGVNRVSAIGAEYFSLRMFGAMGAFVGVACFGWFDGRGETMVPMRALVFANALNIVLDPIFIFGWGPIDAMGVRGAAITTVLSQWTQGGLGLWLLWRRNPLRGVVSGHLRAAVSELLRLGLPMGVQWSFEVTSFAVFASMIAHVGEADITAHNIVVRILSLSFLPGHAIGEAACILTGQAAGASDRDAANRAAASAQRLALVIMGGLGVVFLLGGEWLVAAFRDDVDVLQIGGQLMVVAALFQLFDAVCITRAGALNGVGDTRFVMMACVGQSWFLMLPLAWWLCLHLGWGAAGAWIALTVHIVLVSLVLALRWRSGVPLEEAIVRAEASTEPSVPDVPINAAA